VAKGGRESIVINTQVQEQEKEIQADAGNRISRPVQILNSSMNQDNSVSKEIDLTLDDMVLSPGRRRYFTFHYYFQTGSEVHPVCDLMGTNGTVLGGECEAVSSAPQLLLRFIKCGTLPPYPYTLS
jgi:hypothetical protein